MCLEQGVLDVNHAIAIILTAQAAVAESKCLLIQQPHPVGSFLRWSRLPCNKGKVRNRLEARYSLVGGWERGEGCFELKLEIKSLLYDQRRIVALNEDEES